MASVLTQMLAGQIPCTRLFEDDRWAAVLEPSPLSAGHAFVFPKNEIESWLHLSPSETLELMTLAQKIAKAIQQALSCPRVALAAYGLKTPHVHLHLIPVYGLAGEMDLTRSRPAASPEELNRIAGFIRQAL